MPSLSSLRQGALTGLESAAQSLGTLAPSATLGTVMPLLLGKSGDSTCLLLVGTLLIYVLVANNLDIFASRCASAGSLATYTRMGLGRTCGIIGGWCYLIAMTFVVVSSAVCCAFYVDAILVQAGVGAGGAGRSALVTTAVVLGAWASAYHDIRISTKVMLVAELVSVATLLLILAWAMLRGGRWVDPAQFHFSGSSLAGIRLALILVSTTLAGFESATTLGEEAKGARRSIPRAMLMSLVPTGLLYLSATYCLVALSRRYSLSIDQATLPFQVLADAVGLHWAGWLSSGGIVVSCFVCAMAGLNAGSRVIFSMARAGLLPASLGRIHPVHATPVRAVGVLSVFSIAAPIALLAGGVALTACMDYTIQIDSLGYLGSYLFVCVAAPFFLRREARLSGPHAASAAGAFLALGAMVGLSLFPLPAPPWCYLPLSFIGFLAFGTALSLRPWTPAAGPP